MFSKKEVIGKTITQCAVLFSIFLFSSSVDGQKISYELCKTIENSVVTPFEPTKIYRITFFKSDCVYSFEFIAREKEDKETVTIYVEKYKTKDVRRKEAMKEDRFTLSMTDANGEPLYVRLNINSSGFWDNAILYDSRRGASNLILQKGNFLIDIYAEKETTLRDLEVRFRQIDFAME